MLSPLGSFLGTEQEFARARVLLATYNVGSTRDVGMKIHLANTGPSPPSLQPLAVTSLSGRPFKKRLGFNYALSAGKEQEMSLPPHHHQTRSPGQRKHSQTSGLCAHLESSCNNNSRPRCSLNQLEIPTDLLDIHSLFSRNFWVEGSDVLISTQK